MESARRAELEAAQEAAKKADCVASVNAEIETRKATLATAAPLLDAANAAFHEAERSNVAISRTQLEALLAEAESAKSRVILARD
eukprot:SAG11_NODE_20444_length_445_cov_0.670520_1_plen_84_part_10